MDRKTIIIVCLVVIIAWLLVSRRNEGFSQQIPKNIWTYWEDDNMPELVSRCVAKWREFNPDWTITILNKNNLKQYVPEVDIFSLKFADTAPRRSDFVRLHVLPKYGGVWVDASILPRKSFDWVQDAGSYDFIGYYRKGVTTNADYPVIESWFFACPPGSNFVSKLRDEMMTMNTLDTEADYKKNVESRGVDIQNIPQPDYLNIYLSAQVVLQKQMTPEEIKRTIYVNPAEDGPFKHAVENNWDPGQTIKSLCDNKASDVPDMVKIYGVERQTIEGNSDLKCIYKILD